MKKGEMLSNIIAHAAVAHRNQFDKGGRPYILHVLKVLHNVGSDDEELQCIAVGHDLFEDTKTTVEDLVSLGMTQRVIDGIYGVTKMPGESYESYKTKVKSNLDCIRVKKADLRHNSDIRRLKGVTEKDLKRMAEYQELYDELTKCEAEWEKNHD